MSEKVYCIIVTYNAMRWIDRCLTCISESSRKAETIIVDNCSKDNTILHVKEKYPWVTVIENKENRGFGQANNQGVEYAYKKGATHFFLLNQDAYLNKGAIERLVEVQKRNNLDVVSPIHLNGGGDKMDGGFFSYAILQEKNNTLVTDLLQNTKKDFYRVAFVNAAGWMISRKTIEEIGGFDPLFFHYGEDRNYSQRLKFHHKSLGIVVSAFMYHDREEKGNIKVYDERKYIASLLREIANVNGLSSDFPKMIMYSIINMFKNLFSLKWKAFYLELNAYFKVIGLSAKIRNSKKQNRTIQPNWLNI